MREFTVSRSSLKKTKSNFKKMLKAKDPRGKHRIAEKNEELPKGLTSPVWCYCPRTDGASVIVGCRELFQCLWLSQGL